MTDKGVGTTATKGKRLHFLDNLRTIVILLVLLYHVGGIYEGTGIWAFFWLVDDPATNDLVGLLNIVLDVFVMPTAFFSALSLSGAVVTYDTIMRVLL